jgi:hypothetical protein
MDVHHHAFLQAENAAYLEKIDGTKRLVNTLPLFCCWLAKERCYGGQYDSLLLFLCSCKLSNMLNTNNFLWYYKS